MKVDLILSRCTVPECLDYGTTKALTIRCLDQYQMNFSSLAVVTEMKVTKLMTRDKLLLLADVDDSEQAETFAIDMILADIR